MTEDRAREVLAAHAERNGYPLSAASVRRGNDPYFNLVVIEAMIEFAANSVAGKDEIERLRALVEQACKIGDDYADAYAGTRDEEIIKGEVAAIRAALHHPNVGDKMGDAG